jgi:hypothetical protein
MLLEFVDFFLEYLISFFFLLPMINIKIFVHKSDQYDGQIFVIYI